jgi:hypothetical protein
MDWTNSLATELQTGEREEGSEEELEALEAKAEDEANNHYEPKKITIEGESYWI